MKGCTRKLQKLEASLARFKGRLRLVNGTDAVLAVTHWLIWAALNPDLAEQAAVKAASPVDRAAEPGVATITSFGFTRLYG